MNHRLSFPAPFLFGTATSATQIEGHCTTSDWHAFSSEPGRVRHGDTPEVACDGWNRWREDLALQTSLGMDAYRFSIEWARIEPRAGEIDNAAIDVYRAMLGAMRTAHIEPMVTLHHFALPFWLAESGGILALDFVERFVGFVRVVSRALGDLCRLWITINEPNVLAVQGYLYGTWPPARRSPAAAVRAHGRLLDAHHCAYRALKEERPDACVGVAHHLRAVKPASGTLLDRLATRALRRVFVDAFADAVCRARTQDFFGINYYTRDIVAFSPRRPADLFVQRTVPEGADVSDLGWEIYPRGLGELVREWARRSALPIYVTENGIADAADSRRASFIVRHLAELARAISDGIDVRGYFHWSLLDNFEWADGYEPRFGLVEVDYTTQGRRIRESAWTYARIAKNRLAELA